jgi:hypothetical protein
VPASAPSDVVASVTPRRVREPEVKNPNPNETNQGQLNKRKKKIYQHAPVVSPSAVNQSMFASRRATIGKIVAVKESLDMAADRETTFIYLFI